MSELTPAEIAAFMDVHFGLGDERALENQQVESASWWVGKVQPETPVLPPADGVAYRDSNRQRGLPGALSEAWVAANNGQSRGPIHANIYDSAPPKSLLNGDYLRQPVVSLAMPKHGESDLAYTRRFDAQIRPNLKDLAPEVVEAATAAYNDARERIENGTARQDARKSGDGIGLTGEADPVQGMPGAVSYRELQGSRAETMMTRQQENRDAEAERLTWLRGASRSGYEPLAGEDAATVRQTSRRYGGNGGLFR